MEGLLYKTSKATPYSIERDTLEELLAQADTDKCLWVVACNTVIGKTIMGTWEKVHATR